MESNDPFEDNHFFETARFDDQSDMDSITGEMRSRFVDSKKESPTALAPVPDPAPAVREGKGSFDQHERRMSLKTDSHEDCSLT